MNGEPPYMSVGRKSFENFESWRNDFVIESGWPQGARVPRAPARHDGDRTRYGDQVPAPTSIFQVAWYVGSEILIPSNTMGCRTCVVR